jgi:hypothetical protein
MKRDIKFGFRRDRRSFRAIAILFLLFTAFDITSPELCHERLEELLTRCPSILTSKDSQPVKEVATHISQETQCPSDQHSDQEQHSDDCFCCCAHVLPGSIYNCVGRSELITLSIPLKEESMSSAQLEGPFRPPRLS